jgi:DNA-binding transcriptional LysR family regulator
MQWTDRIGCRLKLRDLNILLTVAQCGSMTKAARQLAVSNPVVSKAIGDLEHAVGVRLLDRHAHGVELTVYGRALLDRGLVAFDELRQAVRHIEFLANPQQGEVRIGSSVAIGASFISVVIDRLSRDYPDIVFHVLAGETAMVYRALAERQVDMVIARIFAPIADDNVTAEVLYDEPQVVAAGAQNGWTRKRKVKLADLMSEPWALPPPESLSGSIVKEAFAASGLPLPRTAVLTSAVPVRNALLATGRFLTIVPASGLKFPAQNPLVKGVPVDLPSTSRPIAITTLRNRTLSPVAQLFADCARKVASRMRPART